VIKILAPVFIFIFLVTGFAFYFYFTKPDNTAKVLQSKPVTKAPTESSSSAELEEGEIAELTSPQPLNISPTYTQVPSNQDAKVTILESKVGILQKRIEQLEGELGKSSTTTQTTTTQTSTKPPGYVFALGSEVSSTTLDWTRAGSLLVDINPADYPGVKSFQLEVEIQQYQGNGTGYARLVNSSDGLSILDSEISTGTQTFTWIGSPKTFSLPSGKKTYVLELKTNTGYQVSVRSFRVKVNY
jgi:hypothetical protein